MPRYRVTVYRMIPALGEITLDAKSEAEARLIVKQIAGHNLDGLAIALMKPLADPDPDDSELNEIMERYRKANPERFAYIDKLRSHNIQWIFTDGNATSGEREFDIGDIHEVSDE